MSRGRVALTVCLALAAIGGGAGEASASGPIKPGLLPLPATVPAELAELEAKSEALQITSLELKLTTSFNLGPKAPKGLSKIFDLGVEGVETMTPPAAAIKLTLFGSHLRLRIVGKRHFLFSWALGRRDGGRPWIELGHGMLGKLLGATGGSSGPKPVTKSFTSLLALLNGAGNLHALGSSTIDGQTVMGFEGEPSSSSLSSGGAGELTGFASARSRTRPKRKAKLKERAVLSLFFAANGLPVRTSLVATSGSSSFTVTLDLPAANFPDAIPAPPASHVITEARLKKLFPPRVRRRHVSSTIVVGKSKQ